MARFELAAAFSNLNSIRYIKQKLNLGKYNHIPLSQKLPDDQLNEEQVRGQLRRERDVERLYIYKNNQQIARFRGHKGYNVINIPETWLVRMKDAIVYHNHLNGSSFSFEDVELIVAYDAKEFG